MKKIIKAIAFNILYVPQNKKEIGVSYKSKYNRKRENQVVLLMIADGKKHHYLALKSIPTANGYNRPIESLSRLLRRVTSNHDGDFYCMSCFHSICSDNSLRKHKRLCGNHNYCNVDMPEKNKNKLKYRYGEKLLKAPFIIYADLECLLKKEQSCQNNPKKSYTERKAKHKPSRYSWSLICSFDETKNKRKFYRRKVVLKSFVKM